MQKILKQIWQNKGNILSGIFNTLFKEDKIEQVYKNRKSICNKCEHIDNVGDKCAVTGTNPCCALCGCSLAFKLRSLDSECPVGKWTAEIV